MKAHGFMAAGLPLALPLCNLTKHMPAVKPPTTAPSYNFLALPLLLEATNFQLVAYDCSLMQVT